MLAWSELAALAAVGFLTTSSNLVGAGLGLTVALPRRLLASVLAFAAGSLISALGIELAFENARHLRSQAFALNGAWSFVAGGFASGAVIYFVATRYLERRGAAIRLPSRFREYAVARKRHDTKRLIALLSKAEILRHLLPDDIEHILDCTGTRRFRAGEIVFRQGDPGDCLFLISEGSISVLDASGAGSVGEDGRVLATLNPGDAFGEMALLNDGPRTATTLASTDVELIEIGRSDFQQLMRSDPRLASSVEALSHSRAVTNLGAETSSARTWAKIAGRSVGALSRHDNDRLLAATGKGAGLAIVLGNILDTIPGCLVIGAKFEGWQSLSIPLITGMFLGGIPEAAASAAMLRRAQFRASAILWLWSSVLIVGIIATVAGRVLIGSPNSLSATFCQAVAGGAVLALVTHAMLPEAIHEGGSATVLPTVAGFLFSLYLTLLDAT